MTNKPFDQSQNFGSGEDRQGLKGESTRKAPDLHENIDKGQSDVSDKSGMQQDKSRLQPDET